MLYSAANTKEKGEGWEIISSSDQLPDAFNRKSEYPSGYRAGVKDKVLDENTIQKGPNAGKVMTEDGQIVSRDNKDITLEHKKAVVEHWNEIGHNSSRAVRNDFYNDTRVC